ncbi:MAG: DUF349 domain-containing protein [Thiohalocapsa sp.]|nr:DUF349 domain-containing protein [Thiohalocapsa sp.]
MFFKRLFVRKTETPAAIDPRQLIDDARHATDSARRRDACRAVNDLHALREIAADDADAGVRDVAAARYRKLLFGLDPRGPSLEARRRLLADEEDQSLLGDVARNGAEAELRADAIARLVSQQALADCAVDDTLAANRQQAVERLAERAALEQVVKRIGKRDKGVYRLARRKLKELAEREERPRRARAQAEVICEKVERLGKFDNWTQDRALLGHLELQWAEIDADLDDALRTRYRAARQAFVDAEAAAEREREQDRARRQARHAAAADIGRLVEQLAALQSLSDPAAVAEQLAAVEQAHAAGVSASDTADDSNTGQAPRDSDGARAYADALAGARAHLERLQGQQQRARAGASLLADIERALEQTSDPDRKSVTGLRKRLERLDASDDTAQACSQALDKLQQRIERQQAQIRRKLTQLPERLALLDRHFEQGQLKKAEPLYQSIAATLEQARAAQVPMRELEPAEAHLKTIAPQLKELQRWRRWSADTHRETLCVEIETLAADEAHGLEPAANRLRELQNAWRKLDRNGAPADDALWQRFHAAAEQVYARCRPFLDAQVKLRAANREQREALCEKLEAFLKQVDWERMDWKKAARAEREMRQAWSALGPVDGRHQSPLEGRFRKSLRRLDKALSDERERNQTFKQDLITRMKALADEPDLELAIERAKALQREWHTTVPARQRDENALWRTFRDASDAVFARRAALHEAKVAELREHQAAREAICAELAELTENAADSESLAAGLEQLERRWNDSRGLPRQSAQALTRRWNELLGSAHKRLRVLREQSRWAALERIERRAALCDEAARALSSTEGRESVNPKSLRERWDALPMPDDEDAAAALEDGFAAVLAAAAGGPDGDASAALAARMRANTDRREDLCLHLEVTTGTDSPPELKQRRMELQVSRLRERMGDGEDDPLADGAALLKHWYLCAPADEPPGIGARFARVKHALTGEQVRSPPAEEARPTAPRRVQETPPTAG